MIPNLDSSRLRRGRPLTALAAPALIVLAACATGATDGPAAPTPAQAGRELAQRECASCHTITELGRPRGGAQGRQSDSEVGGSGDGPPPLRDVLDHYSVNRLRMAFQEGMIVGHAEMPIYRLSDEETDELLAYLQSIRD